jgi:hypothetical protein
MKLLATKWAAAAGTVAAVALAGSIATASADRSQSQSNPVFGYTLDQCKNGGWKTFTNPTFKNQGQCVSFFATSRAVDETSSQDGFQGAFWDTARSLAHAVINLWSSWL